MKKVINFLKNHRIIANLIYMFIAGWLIILAALFFLDHWTHHGEESIVPKVTGQEFGHAASMLKASGLEVILSDSIYDTKRTPGSVVEQSPHPGTHVKPGRIVYLTIVAYSPKMVTVPDYQNMSMRQARAMFEGLGIKEVKIVEVASEYKDLVVGAKFNGMPLRVGSRIPITATITLEVGRGYEETDSIGGMTFEEEFADKLINR